MKRKHAGLTRKVLLECLVAAGWELVRADPSFDPPLATFSKHGREIDVGETRAYIGVWGGDSRTETRELPLFQAWQWMIGVGIRGG